MTASLEKEADLYLEYKQEMAPHLIRSYRQQKINLVAWELFRFSIFESRSPSPEHKQYLRALQLSLSYLLTSPLSLVHQLAHMARTARLLLSPRFPSSGEKEAYLMLMSMEKLLTGFIRKGEYVHYEMSYLFDSIKRLLLVVLDYKDLKVPTVFKGR